MLPTAVLRRRPAAASARCSLRPAESGVEGGYRQRVRLNTALLGLPPRSSALSVTSILPDRNGPRGGVFIFLVRQVLRLHSSFAGFMSILTTAHIFCVPASCSATPWYRSPRSVICPQEHPDAGIRRCTLTACWSVGRRRNLDEPGIGTPPHCGFGYAHRPSCRRESPRLTRPSIAGRTPGSIEEASHCCSPAFSSASCWSYHVAG